MGFFSWLYSDTNKPMKCTRSMDSYLLVPPEFQEEYGEYVYERNYDGLGYMGLYNVYELVAIWNRNHLNTNMIDKPKAGTYGRMYDFEKQKLKEQGLTNDEVIAIEKDKMKQSFERAMGRYQHDVNRLQDFMDNTSDEIMVEKYGEDYLFEIGIDIACDEKNRSLYYPIKIVESPIPYEKAKYSKRDEGQGCD